MIKPLPTSKKKNIEKKLKSYATIATSVLAADASSQVIYTDIPDTTLTNSGDFFDIDFNTDGITDIRISLFHSSGTFGTSSYFKYGNVSAGSVNLNGAELNAQINTYSYYEVAAFSANSVISNSVNSFNSYGYVGWYSFSSTSLGTNSFRSGQFPGQGVKFAGARFQIGTSTHYGWVRLDVPLANNAVTIFDFAYDTTAGASIIAGDTGVSVGISELDAEKINMYANDAILMFPESINKNSEYRVYDLKGQLQERGRIAAGESQHNLKQSYNGVYIVEISNGEGTFRKKLWLES